MEDKRAAWLYICILCIHTHFFFFFFFFLQMLTSIGAQPDTNSCAWGVWSRSLLVLFGSLDRFEIFGFILILGWQLGVNQNLALVCSTFSCIGSTAPVELVGKVSKSNPCVKTLGIARPFDCCCLGLVVFCKTKSPGRLVPFPLLHAAGLWEAAARE